MRLQPIIINFLRFYQAIATCWILVGCQWIDPCQQEEVFRHTSPDKIVDTVLIQKNCGATTSTSNLVFIVPHGESVEDHTPVFIADHVVDLEVEWVNNKQLEIRYIKARIFNYTNFWHSRDIENFKYQIEIHEYSKRMEEKKRGHL